MRLFVKFLKLLTIFTSISRKDNEQNHLIPGLLQVSSKTHFIIDETKLEPGTLGDKGMYVNALSAMSGTGAGHQAFLKSDICYISLNKRDSYWLTE